MNCKIKNSDNYSLNFCKIKLLCIYMDYCVLYCLLVFMHALTTKALNGLNLSCVQCRIWVQGDINCAVPRICKAPILCKFKNYYWSTSVSTLIHVIVACGASEHHNRFPLANALCSHSTTSLYAPKNFSFTLTSFLHRPYSIVLTQFT